MPTSDRYGFGGFVLEHSQQRVLHSDGTPVNLTPRLFSALVLFIESAGELLDKDSMMAALWPGLVVEENNLNQVVHGLRRALNDDGIRFIQTVPRRGFRFVAPVTALPEFTAPPPPGELPSVTDLGNRGLKDLAQVQPQFQLTATDLPSEFPRLRSLAARHNLPVQRSSFVGRGEEIALIRRLLAAHRLVTLTGIGGTGKTRLALQVGSLELVNFMGGVFFVDLAPVSDVDLVPQAVASACELTVGSSPAGGNGALVDLLIAALSPRKCLLIVDNCEHLLDAVADLVDRILLACDDVSVIATSREALGIEGEYVVPVPCLAVSESPHGERNDAVQLFVDRARSVKPSFEIGSNNDRAVLEVCRRLDGIPLAIEFAAARVAHLSVRQIADRLEDRFRLLTGGRRRIHRQQTLTAALDWSHDLLTKDEQMLFRRLAVFAGSFSLGAAEAVCSGAIDARPLIDVLGSLVSKSMVTAGGEEAGEMRYRMLETVRLYASEKLAAANESQNLRTLHRDWYFGWVESISLERLLLSTSVTATVAPEIDNLRAAIDWCLTNGQPERSAPVVSRLYGFWWLSGRFHEGRQRLLEALQGGERLGADERVACHAAFAGLGTLNEDLALVIDHATHAIELAGGRTMPFLVVALSARAFAHSIVAALTGAASSHLTQARSDSESALALTEGLPAEWRAFAHNYQAVCETTIGDIQSAAKSWAATVETRTINSEPGWIVPSALSGLAVSRLLLGNIEGALESATRCHSIPDQALNGIAWWQTAKVELAPVFAAAGQEQLASRILREAVIEVRWLRIPLMENHVLSMCAIVEFLRGRPERAGRLLAAARHVGGATKFPMPFLTPTQGALCKHYLPLVRAQLGPDEAHRARDDGAAMTLDEAFGLAMAEDAL